MMKIYTCAVQPFTTEPHFFARDSGLMCLTFRDLGHESKVILPALPDGPTDESDLVIRASMAELTNPTWWKGLRIDAVAFSCEAFKEFIPMIRAAKQSGTKTCVVFDSSNELFPYFEVLSSIQCLWRKGLLSESMPRRIVGTAARTIVFAAKGLISNYHAAMIARLPDLAVFNTPNTLARARRRERLFFWLRPSSNMLFLGYPVSAEFQPAPLEQRKEQVVAVARWDAVRHKRPHVLMKVVEGVVAQQASASFAIYGKTPDYMIRWHANLPNAIKARVNLAGLRPIQTVAATIAESMILYCPSAREGLPFPVVEALCAGCTVVGLNTPDVPGLAWAFQEGDGTPAVRDSVEAHIGAVGEELGKWRTGQRKPPKIAKKWAQWFSAPVVCRRLIESIECKT